MLQLTYPVNSFPERLFMLNQTFGKWTVISEAIRIKRKSEDRYDNFYECRCVCGTIKLVRKCRLTANKSTQCIKCSTKAIDVKSYLGNKFGKWRALELSESKRGSQTILCECECGTQLIIKASILKLNNIKQCASCFKKENISRLTKHGRSYDSIYVTWQQAKKRCTNTKDKDYHYYGGRGIKMCDRWLNSFECFLKDMGDRPPGYQIDRRNNDGNYEPSNCHWVTPKENANNKRCSKRNTIILDIL